MDYKFLDLEILEEIRIPKTSKEVMVIKEAQQDRASQNWLPN